MSSGGRHVAKWGELNATMQLAMLLLILAALTEDTAAIRPDLVDVHLVLQLSEGVGDGVGLLTAGGMTRFCPILSDISTPPALSIWWWPSRLKRA